MKYKRLISLVVMILVAVASVAGIIFAFTNANNKQDVYGNVSIYVDKKQINLEIEVEKYDDNEFRLKESDNNSAILTITVDGLPDTAHRGVLFNESSLVSGIFDIERVGFDSKKGINRFKITAKDGGSTQLVFTTISGRKSIKVDLNVSLTAKYVTIGEKSHFGVRQDAAPLDFTSSSSGVLSKFKFYAHPDDLKQTYHPNKFPMEYKLAEKYPGIRLEDGKLYADKTSAVGEIYVLGKLPDMDEWLRIPVYVFKAATPIEVTSDAYQANPDTDPLTYDLIMNRTEKVSATFAFNLTGQGDFGTDYKMEVVAANAAMIDVNPEAMGEFNLVAVHDLGETNVVATVYPRAEVTVNGNKQYVWFDEPADANVFITQTVNILIRNEFVDQKETTAGWKMRFSQNVLDAFYYEGEYLPNNYYTEFTLDTVNGVEIEYYNEIEFELVVEDNNHTFTGLYGKDFAPASSGLSDIYEILHLQVFDTKTNAWLDFSTIGIVDDQAYYRSRFRLAMNTFLTAQDFLGTNISEIYLRAKTVYPLSISTPTQLKYATCDVPLNVTGAIDALDVSGLKVLDDGTEGLALVHRQDSNEPSSISFDVVGMIKVGPNSYAPSANWDSANLINNEDLPFTISTLDSVKEINGEQVAYRRYTISIRNSSNVQYYYNYPLTLTYPNKISRTLNVKIYPRVNQIKMNVISTSTKGRVYKTIMDNANNTENIQFVKAVYVRKGHNYRVSVDTPNASVGAYTEVTQTVAGQTVISLDFDATNLAEGVYPVNLRLTASNDDVFPLTASQLNFVVNFIVINPIGNVYLTHSVTLDGINSSTNIQIMPSFLVGETDSTIFDHLKIEQTIQDKHLTVTELSWIVDDDNKIYAAPYNIKADYLTDVDETTGLPLPLTIGFNVYQRYEFGIDFDGDGDNDVFELHYTEGTEVTTSVTINNKIRSSGVSVPNIEGVVTSNPVLGKYITLISDQKPYNAKPISVNVSGLGNYHDVGFTFVKYRNGKYDLDLNYDLADIACLESAVISGNTITLTPKLNNNSMGVYALIVYAKDSLRLLGVVNNQAVATPLVYLPLPIYVGTEKQIEKVIEELAKGELHDANSGQLNDRGGYNWIVNSGNPSTYAAVLFYTREGYGNGRIKANRYRIDDLYSILSYWDGLRYDWFTVTKFVNGVEVLDGYVKNNNGELVQATVADFNDSDTIIRDREGNKIGTSVLRNTSESYKALYLQLNDYSYDGHIVCYRLQGHSDVLGISDSGFMYFYIAEGIKEFSMSITSDSNNGANGVVGTKTLSATEDNTAQFRDTVTVQRGKPFNFKGDTGTSLNSLWNWTNATYDNAYMEATGLPGYEGGSYIFVPHITFAGITFNVTDLTNVINVAVKGGVDYLTIAQESNTIDGANAAVFNATVVVDEAWKPELLNFIFAYEGVRYTLFQDTNTDSITDFIPMDGGNAGFLFNLVCNNPNVPAVNAYYTYSIRVEVAVILKTAAINPFRNVSGARLIIQENLANSFLRNKKTPCEASSELNVLQQGIANVAISHFAITTTKNNGDLELPAFQSNTNVIYTDANISGGVLRVDPTPYYIGVTSIDVLSSYYETEVEIGVGVNGNPIMDKVRYSVGFTQLIYNRDTKTYQNYLSGTSYKMVSSWSAKTGYQWDGYYYFKTFIKYDGKAASRLPDDTKFNISVVIKGEGSNRTITQDITLYAKYKDGIIITPGNTNDVPISTMTQVRYQAIGTTASYDIAFPEGYIPNYNGYTVLGAAKDMAQITVDAISKTLSVRLYGETALIGKEIEIRFPYRAQGDFVNPYMSVKIVPVYFEFQYLFARKHLEAPMLLLPTEDIANLEFSAINNYNSALPVDFTTLLANFNTELRNSTLVSRLPDRTNHEMTVRFSYTYVDGIPKLQANGELMYEQTFQYSVVNTKENLTRTEYLAIGTDATYDLDFDAAYKKNLKILSRTGAAADLWSATVNTANGTIVVALANEKNGGNDLIGKTLTITVGTNFSDAVVLTMNIVPVYFTFDAFKLQNYPVTPLIALSREFTITLEAGNVVTAGGVKATKALQTFNDDLVTIQNNLLQNQLLKFTRVANSSGLLNYEFNDIKRTLKRNDLENPVTATTYLSVTAAITYDRINGVPVITATGIPLSTLFTVKTYGAEFDDDGNQGNAPDTLPSNRLRKVAQAIGTTVTYNIALNNVGYDDVLDKYEVDGANQWLWTSQSKWSASLRGNQVTVTLQDTEALFGKVLVIKIYSHEDSREPAYVLNIVPAWFTVDSFVIVDHEYEKPLQLVSPESPDNIYLDFVTDHANRAGIDYAGMINDFILKLNNSVLIDRVLDDSSFLTISGAVRYVDGIPVLASRNNSSAILLQSTFRCEVLLNGPRQISQAQAIGTEVVYKNLVGRNRKIDRIRYYNYATSDWESVPTTGVEFSVSVPADDQRSLYVKLNAKESLINEQPIRIAVYYYEYDWEMAYIVNIVPSYFVVSGLAVAGQSSSNEVWFELPEEIGADDYVAPEVYEATVDAAEFEAIISPNYSNGFGISDKKLVFDAQLKELANQAKIYRDFPRGEQSGDLRVTVYLKYINGVPELQIADTTWDPNTNPRPIDIVVLDNEFIYTIWRHGEYVPTYPDMPEGPRTRTVNQAIGTTARYRIDLPNQILNSTLAQGANGLWSAAWDGEDIVVTIAPQITILSQADIVLNLYSVFDSANEVFTLTIHPVLFEVIGIGVKDHPETPLALGTDISELNTLQYFAITRHNDTVPNIADNISSFNTRLNNYIKARLQVENDTTLVQYLNDTKNACITIRTAISYRDKYTPSLCAVETHPLDVVESTFKYQTYRRPQDKSITNNYYQAIGTTQKYYLNGIDMQGGNLKLNNNLKETSNIDNGKIVWSAKVKNDSLGYYLEVYLSTFVSMTNPFEVKISDASNNLIHTMVVYPVWFTVDGFEVLNHPERPLWILAPDEKVSTLQYSAKVSFSDLVNESFQDDIAAQVRTFNNNMVRWQAFLEVTTTGGEYINVRGAVRYVNGVPEIFEITGAAPHEILQNTFQYQMYQNSGNQLPATGIIYPTEPKKRELVQAVGTTHKYKLDIPDLTTFNRNNLKLYEQISTNGKMLDWISLTESSWYATVVNGNQLEIELAKDINLVNKLLRIEIYYNAQNPLTALIVEVRPVWFTVTDLAIENHPEAPIVVTSDAEYNTLVANWRPIPVLDYCTDLLSTIVGKKNGVGITLQTKINDYIFNFKTSKIPPIVESNQVSYLQASCYVGYSSDFDGEIIETRDLDGRLTRAFKVVRLTTATAKQKSAVQGIGTTKTYYLGDGVNVPDATYQSADGVAAIAVVKNNYAYVQLVGNYNYIGTTISINFDNKFTLYITPVWFEVVGFEVAEHDERPVWVIDPSTTSDFTYTVRTTLANDDMLDVGVRSLLDDKIATFNKSLKDNRILLSEQVNVKGKYLIINGAIDYVNGVPELVRMRSDITNIVEEIIPFVVWADNKEPNPEHPPVMTTIKSRQIIGGSKKYILSNVKGKVFYQNIWVTGAGSMTVPHGSTGVTYEGANIIYDINKNTLQVEITGDQIYLYSPIRVCIPYLVTSSHKETWYTYCIEITPVLYEVIGWTIEAVAGRADQISDFILLNKVNPIVTATFKAKVNRSNSSDRKLQLAIDNAIKDLEREINRNPSWLIMEYKQNNVKIDKEIPGALTLTNIAPDNNPTETRVNLSGYVTYVQGIPQFVQYGDIYVANEIMICTGNYSPFPPDCILGMGQQIIQQAIGTTNTYLIDIPNAVLIDYDAAYLDTTTQNITVEGEPDLFSVNIDKDESTVSVTLAPIKDLIGKAIIIRIPYKTIEDGQTIKREYVFDISPVLFNLTGLYLQNYPNNYVQLNDIDDAQIKFSVLYEATDNANLRSEINDAVTKLEKDINDMVENELIDWQIDKVYADDRDPFVKISKVGQYIFIQRALARGGSNYIHATFDLYYTDKGMVTLNNNGWGHHQYTVEITATTSSASSSMPGIDKMTLGVQESYVHPIGKTKTYVIDTTANAKQVLNFDKLEVLNGGPKIGPRQYEWFDIQWEGSSSYGEIVITFKAQTRLLIDPIDVRIPYYVIENDVKTWYYYSLKIKPVLFEVLGWGVKEDEFATEVKNEIILDNKTSPELYFGAKILSAPLDAETFIDEPFIKVYTDVKNNVNYWERTVNGSLVYVKNGNGQEYKSLNEIRADTNATDFTESIIANPENYQTSELIFIQNSIRNLEQQLNKYDESVADKYLYMIINNTAEDGYSINYSLYRDDSEQKTYLQRETSEATTTIMSLAANISYQVNGFDSKVVEGIQAVIGYQDENGMYISGTNSNVKIITTDMVNAAQDLRVITQDNAYELMNLSANTDYILMSDISLTQAIAGYTDGVGANAVNWNGWRPVPFPQGTTLDGNNFKIFVDGDGFDLRNNPNNVGIFTEIPSSAVIKNVQIVIPQGVSFSKAKVLNVDLGTYQDGSVNIGLLAGVNNGIVTNCAVLSEWQFVQDLTTINNPFVADSEIDRRFNTYLQFNKDGYLFGQLKYEGVTNYYFFDPASIEPDPKGGYCFTRIYDANGYRLKKNENNKWVVSYDKYHNVTDFIAPDRSNVAKYEGYSAIMADGYAAGRVMVINSNSKMNIVLGGLVGINNHMITNSRVLVDVILDGPAVTTGSGQVDELSVTSAIVGGLVGTNASSGTITTSFFRDGNVVNNANAGSANAVCYVGGFVGNNFGIIMQSYAMGKSTGRENTINHISSSGGVITIRNSLGGFVHQNSGKITDCLVNMLLEKSGPEGGVGGFVYRNMPSGVITNCVENSTVVLTGNNTLTVYSPFVAINGSMTDKLDDADPTGLSNLYYAGNQAGDPKFVSTGVLKRLNNNAESRSERYTVVENFKDFSIGQDDNEAWVISGKNTIWKMTSVGPMLREANNIAVSYRKTAWVTSPYLYKPGTAKNPCLVWNKETFHEHVYEDTPSATVADAKGGKQDVEANRQSNHLRLIDNVTLNGIQDTYKITYTGTFEGNGLTLNGINLPTAAKDTVTLGLFGKTEYATIRNINFGLSGNINTASRYVGSIAGISINTNFVDVKIAESSVTVVGANIVGGIAGLAVITDSNVENYNVSSGVSVNAEHHNSSLITPGTTLFTSGLEYYRQTLYSRVTFTKYQTYTEQAFGVAGGIFGFVTANPNNYRYIDKDGNEQIKAREYSADLIVKDNLTGEIKDKESIIGVKATNQDGVMFLKDEYGKAITDPKHYNRDQAVLRNFKGAIQNVSGNVAGGLIGIMDETIELHDADLTALGTLTGKYYLGGLVGINVGKIIDCNLSQKNKNGVTQPLAFSIASAVPNKYVYRVDAEEENPKGFWGMTIGGVAAYHDGISGNENSGVIANVNANVNILGAKDSKNVYVIGGVAGQTGEYAYIDKKSINPIFNSDTSVLATNNQLLNVGYYFGKIVGRGSGSSKARMPIMAIPIADSTNYAARYVNQADFATPNFKFNGRVVNAFGVNSETTPKVQSMVNYTGDDDSEYQRYMREKFSPSFNGAGITNIVDLIKELEPFFRSLPTEIVLETFNKGTSYSITVPVEKLVVNETTNVKQDFIEWLKSNEIFGGKLPYELQGKVLDDYIEYISYCAVGERGKTEKWLEVNIDKYREERYQMALEFFEYKQQAANGDSYSANANFTWGQYCNYRYMLRAIYGNTAPYTVYANDAVMMYPNISPSIADITTWTKDLNADDGRAELLTTDPRNKFTVVKNNDILKDLVKKRYQAEDLSKNIKPTPKFDRLDPLQAYINYIADGYQYVRRLGKTNELVTHRSACAREDSGRSWKLPLPVYYHYVVNISQRQSGETVDNVRYYGYYDLDMYASYLYGNILMSQTSSKLLTLDEYISFILREQPIVMKNEYNWVTTGHLGNGIRISEIGALEMKWAESQKVWEDDILNDRTGTYTVEARDNCVYFTTVNNGATVEKVWNAIDEYNLAKAAQGLTIVDYQEIVRLGGSLYELRSINKGTGTYMYQTASAYLFHLKVPQYGWTDKQEHFIEYTYGLNNLRYALTATYLGDLGDVSAEKARAVSVNSAVGHRYEANSSGNYVWYADQNGNGKFELGVDREGTWLLASGNMTNSVFVNGDGQEYYLNLEYNFSTINLLENTAQGRGAALYIDADGDKMFTSGRSISGDILCVYPVPNDMCGYAEFYQPIEDSTEVQYYRIIRRIVESNDLPKITSCSTWEAGDTEMKAEHTDNVNDFLEEAWWWYTQGFTAEQFAKIKTKMTENIGDATGKGQVLLKEFVAEKKYMFPSRNNTGDAKRYPGFTIADDWLAYVVDAEGSTSRHMIGFGMEGFNTGDYTEIVIGGSYDDHVWYSAYADYLVFCVLLDPEANATHLENLSADYLQGKGTPKHPKAVSTALPVKTKFVKATGLGSAAAFTAKKFKTKLSLETELADVMDFADERAAFVALKDAGTNTTEYLEWTQSRYGKASVTNSLGETNEKYFRLNHFIYWKKHEMDNPAKGNVTRNWRALQNAALQSYRAQINYDGVTQESRTSDLVEYFCDWYNNGPEDAFITFRDWCEWINVYKYGSDYRIDRGEVADEINGEKVEASSAGWLTVDAYAVWKRMEKYENNIEYINGVGESGGVEQILAPILKRKISTTIFPKIQSSGNTEWAGQRPTLASNFTNEYYGRGKEKTDAKDETKYDLSTAEYLYNWQELLYDADGNMRANYVGPATGRQRHYVDRYEYNEKYQETDLFEITSRGNAKEYIDCLPSISGYNLPCNEGDNCSNPMHRCGQLNLWRGRYNNTFHNGKHEGDSSGKTLGEVRVDILTGVYGEDKAMIFDELAPKDEYGRYTMAEGITDLPNQFAQLYVPYDYFKTAAKKIMSYYSEDTGYQGYHNYMKYWARNGEYNWIGDVSEYTSINSVIMDYGIRRIQNTYLATRFWENFSPNVDAAGHATAFKDIFDEDMIVMDTSYYAQYGYYNIQKANESANLEKFTRLYWPKSKNATATN